MMTRNYYCLVAGLPDLLMEDRKMAYTSLEFREMLQEELHPKDYTLISQVFLKYDHQNILAKLYSIDISFDKRGILSEGLIEEITDNKAFELYEGNELPVYLNDFLKDFFEQDEKPPQVVAERGISAAFYSMFLNQSNVFVKRYAEYEANLRNLFIALNGRKHNMEFENEIVGFGDVVDALRKSRARDFGLGADLEDLDALIQIHENPDILDRELKLDTMRWQFLDESSFFNYFTVEKVMAFTLKLMITERWFELDEEKGKELFKRLLNDLETGYDFPEEFKLSHGKKK